MSDVTERVDLARVLAALDEEDKVREEKEAKEAKETEKTRRADERLRGCRLSEADELDAEAANVLGAPAQLTAWIFYGRAMAANVSVREAMALLSRLGVKREPVHRRDLPFASFDPAWADVREILLSHEEASVRIEALAGGISPEAARVMLVQEPDEDVLCALLRSTARVLDLATDPDSAAELNHLLEDDGYRQDAADALMETLLEYRRRIENGAFGLKVNLYKTIHPMLRKFCGAAKRRAYRQSHADGDDLTMRLGIMHIDDDPFLVLDHALQEESALASGDAEAEQAIRAQKADTLSGEGILQRSSGVAFLPGNHGAVAPLPAEFAAEAFCAHFETLGRLGESARLRAFGKTRFGGFRQLLNAEDAEVRHEAMVALFSNDPRTAVRRAVVGVLRLGEEGDERDKQDGHDEHDEAAAVKLFADPAASVRVKVLERGFAPRDLPATWLDQLGRKGSCAEQKAAADLIFSRPELAEQVRTCFEFWSPSASDLYAARVREVIRVAKGIARVGGGLTKEKLEREAPEALLRQWLGDDADEANGADWAHGLTAIRLMRAGVSWLDYETWED